MSASLQRHYVYISVYKKYPNEPPIKELSWHDMSFDFRMRWNWYFKYRAARLQVEHPRALVELATGFVTETDKDRLKRLLNNRIIAKKRKITEMTNIISLSESNWNCLFPITDDPTYQRAKAKLYSIKTELLDLEAAQKAKDYSVLEWRFKKQ